ncbi:glucosamine-6-phosphate deaminase [Corynebacterium fournieri]|uniref:glucosamine-6-phosphate deaminase n=1 Tax=Corynebacterium fournieri TaxID=1852390 RepID=UPI000A2F578B|nr:glucosamine-6-phosphate deaminase [Corynebacterium fournieri]WJY97746.1 Glucosamine-6-phosphate deaminase [Corynebacterium fournieri]
MDIIVRPTAEKVGVAAADLIEPFVRRGATLGLATGSTPNPLYMELARRHREEDLSFAECDAFLLDEYVGLERTDEQSYYATIRREFTRHIDIDDEKVHSLNGLAEDPEAEARSYEERIHAAGGVDVQILGVGANGHIAFNEPPSPLDSRTRQIDLHPTTVADNARFFDNEDQVPRTALTQGVGTIMEAHTIVLIATGAHKAEAVKALVEGPVTPGCPASVLQNHPRATIILDEDAASKLER